MTEPQNRIAMPNDRERTDMIEPHWQLHEGSGPLLLLVHGFLSSRAQWLLNLEALGTACRPVTVELFGHHLSPSPTDVECYDPDYYVDCFERIRAALGAERWFVLGYSLGAGLTLRYAMTHPDRVVGHLFTNSTSGLADAARQAEFRRNGAEVAARIRTGGHAAMAKIPVHPRHGRKLPRPVYDALLADAETHDPAGIANTVGITNPQVSMRGRLVENARPACLIWGTRERRFQEAAAFAQASMPGLTVAPLDAGHAMNMEQPDAFNDAVLRFLRQCR
ncbi:MAG: alpha/beta fold hydrolase [Pseudomonadales bacterium]